MIRGGYWGGAWGLSWGGAWGEAWFLLNQPYQELSLKGQVFVRSYLTNLYSVEVAEQIVSVAVLNSLSVTDAEAVVAAKIARKSLSSVERKARKPSVQQETGAPSISNSKDRKTLFCAVSQNKLITQVSTDEMTVSVGTNRTLFVHRAEQAQYIKKGTKQ